MTDNKLNMMDQTAWKKNAKLFQINNVMSKFKLKYKKKH